MLFHSAVYVIASALFASALQPIATDPSIDGSAHSWGEMPAAVPQDDASGNQVLAIGANANTLRMPVIPQETGGVDMSAINTLAGLGVPAFGGNPASEPHQPSAYENRIRLLRREASAPHAAESGRMMMSEDDHHDSDENQVPHKAVYQEDPRFSPEAIFADKKLAPEVAEFLGHLAQRGRVHRKVVKAAREAGLAQSGEAHVVSNEGEGDNDDSDDIEDMRKAANSMPKKTALSHFFEQLDTKTKSSSWMEKECTDLAKNVTTKYQKMFGGRSQATWGTAGPAGMAQRAEIHTGMFFKRWTGSKTKEAARKLRLGVLSFLATQDPQKVKLHIWTDVDKNSDTMKEMLGPIGHHPELMDAINITTFDPKIEFLKVPPTVARERLEEHYKKDPNPEIRSDLYRAVVLYNYGGLWMDADTVLMQDVAPLFGEDWAHLVRGREGAIGGGLLSASGPKSHFTNAYLISVVMREPPMDEEEKKAQKPLLVEIFENDPAHTILHVLPPCFLDTEPSQELAGNVAVLASDAGVGGESVFFGKAVAQPYRAFFSSGIKDASSDNSTSDVSALQETPAVVENSDDDDDKEKAPAQAPTWAYHWRGNFAAPWARGSLADVAERTFMKQLKLHQVHSATAI